MMMSSLQIVAITAKGSGHARDQFAAGVPGAALDHADIFGGHIAGGCQPLLSYSTEFAPDFYGILLTARH